MDFVHFAWAVYGTITSIFSSRTSFHWHANRFPLASKFIDSLLTHHFIGFASTENWAFNSIDIHGASFQWQACRWHHTIASFIDSHIAGHFIIFTWTTYWTWSICWKAGIWMHALSCFIESSWTCH